MDIFKTYDIDISFLDGLLNLFLLSESKRAKKKADSIIANIDIYKKIDVLNKEIKTIKAELIANKKKHSDASFLSKQYKYENKQRLKNNRRFVNSKQGSFDDNFAKTSSSLKGNCYDLAKEEKILKAKLEILNEDKDKLKKQVISYNE